MPVEPATIVTLTSVAAVNFAAISAAVVVKLLATAIVRESFAIAIPGKQVANHSIDFIDNKWRRTRSTLLSKLRFLLSTIFMQEGFRVAIRLITTFEHQRAGGLESDA